MLRQRESSRRSLTADDFFIASSYKKLCEALEQEEEQKVFYGEGFGSRDLKKMFSLLQENSTLQDLILKDCGATQQQMKGLFEAIEGNESLQSLKFSAPPIQDTKGEILLSYLESNRTVKCLNLHGNELNKVSIRNICKGLEVNTTLTDLNLGSNQFRKDGCEYIGKALRTNTSLRFLDLSYAEIDEHGAKQIAQGLAVNSTLHYLRLSMNVLIKNEGLRHMCEALERNSSLQSLVMRYTHLSSKGMAYVAACLQSNRSLTSLDLLFNAITDEGVNTLVEALRYNRHIMYIRISDKKASAEALEALDNGLKLNRGLRKQAFIDATESGHAAHWRRGKLMVVGEGKSGKSSTMRSISGLHFEPQWRSTIGVEVNEVQTFPKRGWLVSSSREYARSFVDQLALSNWQEGIHRWQKRKTRPGDKADEARTKSRKPRESSTSRLGSKPRAMENPQVQVVPGMLFDYDEERFLEAERSIDGLQVSTWDFGGQKVFNTLHHLFLTNFGIYLLVFNLSTFLYNVSSSVQKLEFWLNSIRLHALDARILLVGTFAGSIKQTKLNKINVSIKDLLVSLTFDLKQFTQLTTGLLFHAIDNRTRMGVAELQSRINKELLKVEHLNLEVPLSWTLSLDSMRRTSENWITRGKVDQIVKDYGVTQAKETGDMLQHFHQLGILLYLTGTETLQTLITLDAQWVVSSVAKLIHDPQLHSLDKDKLEEAGLVVDWGEFQTRGLVSRDLIEYFWDKRQVDFLLELTRDLLLLSKFKFHGQEERYLVPAMIQGRNYTKLDDIGGAAFAFRFVFLADGVFERLVCLCISYLSNLKSLPSPVLKQDTCKVQFNEGTDVQIDRIDRRIVVSTKQLAFATKLLVIFQSWMARINTEAMGGMLKWEIEVKDDEFVPLSEAKDNPKSKWNSQAQAHISAASLDMEGAFGETS